MRIRLNVYAAAKSRQELFCICLFSCVRKAEEKEEANEDLLSLRVFNIFSFSLRQTIPWRERCEIRRYSPDKYPFSHWINFPFFFDWFSRKIDASTTAFCLALFSSESWDLHDFEINNQIWDVPVPFRSRRVVSQSARRQDRVTVKVRGKLAEQIRFSMIDVNWIEARNRKVFINVETISRDVLLPSLLCLLIESTNVRLSVSRDRPTDRQADRQTEIFHRYSFITCRKIRWEYGEEGRHSLWSHSSQILLEHCSCLSFLSNKAIF